VFSALKKELDDSWVAALMLEKQQWFVQEKQNRGGVVGIVLS